MVTVRINYGIEFTDENYEELKSQLGVNSDDELIGFFKALVLSQSKTTQNIEIKIDKDTHTTIS